VTLQSLIVLKLMHIPETEILGCLGYRGGSLANAQTALHKIKTSSSMGLDNPTYGYRYSHKQLIIKFCELLKIDQDFYLKELSSIEDKLATIQQAFKSYLFVETGFVRKNQPIFVLALLESERRIFLSKTQRIKPISQQVEIARQLAIEHFEQRNGQLTIWGNIHYYVFYYCKDDHVVITPSGQLREQKIKPEQRATLTVKGKQPNHLLNLHNPKEK